MEFKVPMTNSPACPTTVQWFGKPGMDGYGMVTCGVFVSRPLDNPDRPEPQIIPTFGDGIDLD